MSDHFSLQEPSGADSPIATVVDKEGEESNPQLLQRVGRVLLRRIRYCGRYLFWTIRHRSTEHAAWACACEGYSWN